MNRLNRSLLNFSSRPFLSSTFVAWRRVPKSRVNLAPSAISCRWSCPSTYPGLHIYTGGMHTALRRRTHSMDVSKEVACAWKRRYMSFIGANSLSSMTPTWTTTTIALTSLTSIAPILRQYQLNCIQPMFCITVSFFYSFVCMSLYTTSLGLSFGSLNP